MYELAAAGPAPITSKALERIARLYAIEVMIRGRTADERRAVRHEKSRPVVDEFKPWLRAKLGLIGRRLNSRRPSDMRCHVGTG